MKRERCEQEQVLVPDDDGDSVVQPWLLQLQDHMPPRMSRA